MKLKLQYSKILSETYGVSCFTDNKIVIKTNLTLEELKIDPRFEITVEFVQKEPKCGLIFKNTN